MGVGTNFGGGRRGQRRGPKGRQRGWGLLGRGQQAPPHQLWVCGSVVSSVSGVRGGAPAAEGFSCILSCQIAFPSISVRVAYSLHGWVLVFLGGYTYQYPLHINSWGCQIPCIPPLPTPVNNLQQTT